MVLPLLSLSSYRLGVDSELVSEHVRKSITLAETRLGPLLDKTVLWDRDVQI